MTTIDFTHFATVIRAEMGQLKVLSETAKESRAAVGLDQQSVGRLSRMDALQQQSMELATEGRRQQAPRPPRALPGCRPSVGKTSKA